MSSPKVYVADQKACDCCGDLFRKSVETWKGHMLLYCDKPACNKVARNRPKSRYVEAGTLKCTASECDNYVTEGSYGRLTRKFVCSVQCWKKRAHESPGRMVAFKCGFCGKDTAGPRSYGYVGRRFCNRDHAGKFKHEKTLARAGIYRTLFDEYCQTSVQDQYNGQSIQTHVHANATFLGFLNEIGVTSLNDVDPLTISKYGKWGRDKGTPNLMSEICHVKMFFDWQIAMGMRLTANPVVSLIHRKRKPQRKPRPYSQAELDFIDDLLDRRGNSRLRAAEAIAEESGLRREEICNIRLADVDLDRYEIFVRLPNKTSTERTARFGEKAKVMISAWLRDRDPNCGHDHLLHNTQNNPCNGIQMHLEFVKVLCKTWLGQKLHDEGLESWSIHKLRHTMATRLAAGGADASTIMGAGGWKTYTAMAGYTAVDPEDSRRGYEEAMRRAAESLQSTPQTVALSLEQYLERTHKAA
jgi:integrase/recombinase XerC